MLQGVAPDQNFGHNSRYSALSFKTLTLQHRQILALASTQYLRTCERKVAQKFDFPLPNFSPSSPATSHSFPDTAS